MSQIIYSPHPIPASSLPKIFLSGSIDNGQAVDWQTRLCDACPDLDVIFLNPRRPDWDSTWEPVKSNPLFHEQVSWELDGLELADLIVVYITAASKAPITLLELGLHARQDNLVVCCEEGFWRKGNVDIVCERYGIAQVDTFDELLAFLKSSLAK
jgi:Nucleoside 2-deoxyribosyltransferase like